MSRSSSSSALAIMSPTAAPAIAVTATPTSTSVTVSVRPSCRASGVDDEDSDHAADEGGQLDAPVDRPREAEEDRATAPTEAPLATPTIVGSASGLRKTPWSAAPETASAPPTKDPEKHAGQPDRPEDGVLLRVDARGEARCPRRILTVSHGAIRTAPDPDAEDDGQRDERRAAREQGGGATSAPSTRARDGLLPHPLGDLGERGRDQRPRGGGRGSGAAAPCRCAARARAA